LIAKIRKKIMVDIVKWESSMDAALLKARVENKPVLLDFFNPN